MNALRNLQQDFLSYLLNESSVDVIGRIESNSQCMAGDRMALYGNAYVLRLKEALSTDYERLHIYLGDELFEKLQQNYITVYPSHHPSLRYFGQHMVDIVEQLEPFSQLPEVAEIARIEKAFLNSFDAADKQCVGLDYLAKIELEAWPVLTFRFHDSLQLLPQHHNSFQIWKALADGQTPPQRTDSKTTWIIWRQDLVSRYRALEAAELTALTIAMSGGDFAEVCEALLEHYSETETPQKAVMFLQQWINNQMVCEFN